MIKTGNDVEPDWGPPDADGLLVAWQSDPLKSTGRGRRLRQAAAGTLPDVDAWPTPWREVAVKWVRQAHAGKMIRLDTLLGAAGPHAVTAAQQLLRVLLSGGAIRIDEKRHPQRGWELVRIAFLAPQTLRTALGLPEPDEADRRWAELRNASLAFEDIDRACASLDELPPRVALARHDLLTALIRWRESGRHRGFATRRDFAFFARGETKSISEAEWRWLEATIDLSADGISAHAPLMPIAGSLVLHGPAGRVECAALGGFVAFSPQAIDGIRAISEPPARWLLVENRSAFEQQARSLSPGHALLWLPGYPPGWWRTATARLLTHAPAPASIACDPDPDGIRIALAAGRLWESCGLAWSPWRMAPDDLAGLAHRRALSDRDLTLLDELDALPLPAEFAALSAWMRRHQEKGEQEAFFHAK